MEDPGVQKLSCFWLCFFCPTASIFFKRVSFAVLETHSSFPKIENVIEAFCKSPKMTGS